MKKIFISLLVAATCGMSAQSVKYGVTGNAHISGISNVYNASKPLFGGGFGVFAEIPLYPTDAFKSQYMFIQPQVEFSMQGEAAEAPGFEKQKFKNNYLTAAVYFKYYFHSETMRNNFFLFGGPKAEFLVSNTKDTSLAYEVANYRYNLDNNVNSFGLGVSAGAGYNFASQWEVFARYDQGLTKVYKDNPNTTLNGVIALGLNYTFSTKKSATTESE